MRIRSLYVSRWRNLVDLRLDVPPEARFVCLVGENGTGKSSVLELIAWSAHQLGLAAQVALRRPVPQATPGSDYRIEVCLATEREAALREIMRPQVGDDAADRWNGEVTLRVQSWSGADLPSGIPQGIGVAPHPSGGMFTALLAGGLDSSVTHLVGPHVVSALRSLPELLHLYIDAERVFPAGEVQDQEILALARQDPHLPEWLKQQAAQMTQNLYLEWMRSMLGRQQRLQTEYFQAALHARDAQEPVPPPEDPLGTYRTGLRQVLPHLHFVRLDQEARRLIFDSAGSELPYEELSGGERELAFLIGQLDRFELRDGLFLLDEPELHLNPELLRGWLDYLRSTIGLGQAWVATHSLEAAEIAGPVATIVLERDEDRAVRHATPLGERPALTTLAAAVGTPAFSVARSRFVLIEGTRERRERERFATVLEAQVADRFIEADGCDEVINRVRALRGLASEEEQLRVAGILDRDFRTDAERVRMLADNGIHVLSLHEVENFFLQPELIRRLLVDSGRDPELVLEVLQRAADPHAGRWALSKTAAEELWREDIRSAMKIARSASWADLSADLDAAAREMASVIPGLIGAEVARRRLAIRQRLECYSAVRVDEQMMSQQCFGKEVLPRVASDLGYQDASAVEARAAVLWRSREIVRPPAAGEVRAYLDSVPVLRG